MTDNPGKGWTRRDWPSGPPLRAATADLATVQWTPTVETLCPSCGQRCGWPTVVDASGDREYRSTCCQAPSPFTKGGAR